MSCKQLVNDKNQILSKYTYYYNYVPPSLFNHRGEAFRCQIVKEWSPTYQRTSLSVVTRGSNKQRDFRWKKVVISFQHESIKYFVTKSIEIATIFCETSRATKLNSASNSYKAKILSLDIETLSNYWETQNSDNLFSYMNSGLNLWMIAQKASPFLQDVVILQTWTFL